MRCHLDAAEADGDEVCRQTLELIGPQEATLRLSCHFAASSLSFSEWTMTLFGVNERAQHSKMTARQRRAIQFYR